MNSNLSLRETYGKTLVKLGNEDKDIVVLDADLSKSTMTCYFEEKFPNRFFEMGIAEQNMVSVGVGLALTGKTVFCNSFSVFITGRAYDQVRVGLALSKSNVKLVGSSAGLSDDDDGATHQSIDDISIMRSLPNMVILVPLDAIETKKMTEYISKYKGPVYMRINKQKLPIIFKEEWDFELGKIFKIRDGKDIAILSNGIMVSKSLAAAEVLEKMGISVSIFNVSTVKPLDKEKVKEIAEKFKKIIIAEEHSVIGGLGSAIIDALKSEKDLSILLIGIEDVFGRSACSYEELLNYYGLSVQNIINKAEGMYRKE